MTDHWQNRITGSERVPPEQLLANPSNQPEQFRLVDNSPVGHSVMIGTEGDKILRLIAATLSLGMDVVHLDDHREATDLAAAVVPEPSDRRPARDLMVLSTHPSVLMPRATEDTPALADAALLPVDWLSAEVTGDHLTGPRASMLPKVEGPAGDRAQLGISGGRVEQGAALNALALNVLQEIRARPAPRVVPAHVPILDGSAAPAFAEFHVSPSLITYATTGVQQ